MIIRVLFTLLICSATMAASKPEIGHFSGRISKINHDSKTLRFKISFENSKYLNSKDLVEFWDERRSNQKCRGFVVGKTKNYLTLRISKFSDCEDRIFVSNGVYLKFYSQDLANNIKVGKEVVGILLKKRLAISGLSEEAKKNIETHEEKVSAINQRYELLKSKLEKEWTSELAVIEEEKTRYMKDYRNYVLRLNAIDLKLERYRIFDDNMSEDRWSLDQRLYFRK